LGFQWHFPQAEERAFRSAAEGCYHQRRFQEHR
jgi:hypothetical protein